MPLRRFLLALAAMVLLGSSAAAAQAPESIDGELVVVPVVEPGSISLDGDLGDWATLPAVITNTGPQPSDDLAARGELRWQIAATDEALYVAATITDDLIVAGQNGSQYWREDSVEVYANFGDLAATEYGDRVGQITVSPIDRGNTDPEAITITGLGSETFNVLGLVFDTADGWGFEIAVALDDLVDIASTPEFGFQIQANGTSGVERDMKISWSTADTEDQSFTNPSVFGRGVFAVESADNAVVTDESPPPTPTSTASEQQQAAEDVDAEVSVDVEAERPDTEPEAGRTLLIAAVISAASILIGGLWFERRRKKSEAEMAAARSAASDDDKREPDDDEFDAMITSILDE